MSFSTFGFSEPILTAIDEIGFVTPTAIQLAAIPAVLSGKDIIAVAQTGSGKTASFLLPLLERLIDKPKVKANQVRALILTPTRELSIQIGDTLDSLRKNLALRSQVVYGGVKINPQMMKLRGGTEILVATPGRLLDLFSKNALKFQQLEILVLDEADRMLDMGFSKEIIKILALLPRTRQSLLFSATFSNDIQGLAAGLLKSPVLIDVSPHTSVAPTIQQWAYEVDKEQKAALLIHLIRSKGWGRVLVFTRTQKGADNLVKKLLRTGISAAAIHGDKSQGVRMRTLDEFKAAKIQILIATDIAARGIDIDGLPQVINFDLPKDPQNYIHRIGRTGRAGTEGQGLSLVSADEVELLANIEALTGQTLTREIETGFSPSHKIPLTKLQKSVPKKPRKPKLKKLNSCKIDRI